MNRKLNIYMLIVSTVFLTGITSCDKYLEIKSDETFDLIDQVEDLQALLDNTSVMNASHASMPEIASDNYFITNQEWQNLTSLTQKNGYIWDNDVFNDSKNNDWFYIYRSVMYSNLVLDNINEIIDTEKREQIRSSALFYRAWSLHQALQIWTKPYEKESSTSSLGIPLKTNPNFDEVSRRASLEESYAFVLSDLKKSLFNLPIIADFKTRPSRGAGFALLSRIYLSMNNYTEALVYADSALQINSSLMDYNAKNLNTNTPFERFNNEVIFHATSINSLILNNPRGKIDVDLYNSYGDGDLRKQGFFRENGNYYSFKGSYDGSTRLFCGLATDEMYLNRAECLVRVGRAEEAALTMKDLLSKRYRERQIPDMMNLNNDQLLDFVLEERRKELIYRHSRWMDLRRLNHGGGRSVAVKRMVNDERYELRAGSSKYAFQIPLFIVENSGVVQND